MSVKKEYDLFATPVDNADSFEIDNIEIKFELPYQSIQFQLSPDIQDDQKHEENQLHDSPGTDPLECDDAIVQPTFEQNITTITNNPSYFWAPTKVSKKLKPINTAICTKCNLGFPSPFLFEQHMIEIHQDDRPYPCKHCSKPFATPAQQKMHETIHDPKRFQGEPQYSCDLCSKSYHLKRSLATHKLKTHKGYKPPKRPRSTPVKEHHSTSGSKNPNAYRKPKETHSCPQCDLTFPMKCLLRTHMFVHSKERPFSCHICQQPFPRKTSLTTHIKRIHQNTTTPTGKSHIRPKWQANQPCPCTICGKIFRVPSQLSKHFRLHTGEKPYSCMSCDAKFRTKNELVYHTKQNHLKTELLANPLKLFKCRICGKNDFVFFRDLRQHRYGVHRNIPYESEMEKPFACGICGKPHFLREGALICAILGHDPEALRKDMFKIKCSECPDKEIFGFHNVLALRRHWDKEHGDKQLPARYRLGMNGKMELKDELPSYRFDKKKRELIVMNGPDKEQVKSGPPLYVDLDLLDVPVQDRFFKRSKQKKIQKYMEHNCKICGLKLASSSTFQRHMKVVHDPNRLSENNKWNECGTCGRIFTLARSLTRHKKTCNLKKNWSGKGTNYDNYNGSGNGEKSVNVNRQGDVQAILNFQTVTVNLKRLQIY